jgi:hypothetical protein
MGCAHRRFGDHSKASECFKLALAQPEGEDAFQRVNTLMLLSNSLSSLQRYVLRMNGIDCVFYDAAGSILLLKALLKRSICCRICCFSSRTSWL